MKTPNAVEVHPCVVVGNDSLGNEIMEQCESDDPNIATWSVYWHLEEGGLVYIEDFPTQQEAEQAAALLERGLEALR